ncbi:alpha/beta fold hydrolase [Arenicella xantha]|uniref:Pimeloyl-ACP methyl ester carboxylesterase n=1 Tax=Arenicella xantha TaxID=644221 RepID=A0A395JJL2_9GAMM|nr:alpha/beta hydrolase [Arenicella xantha]RBP49082.1 pimeloyl-ACP methyl ester carboxylesterase [Arenicella xantha]
MSTSPHTFHSEAVANWFNRGRYRTLAGKTIFTIDEGDARLPVIVLIHGFPTSSFDWLPMWDTFVKQYRLVSLDMHGFGFSDKPDSRTYSIHQQADLFEELIGQLRIENYHVLAHDYGVSVAQELLARQLDGSGIGSWQSLCLLNGGLFPETHRALIIQKLMLSRLGKYINKFTGFEQFKQSFSSVFGPQTKPSDRELQEFWELINFNHGRHVFHNLITYILDRREHRERWVTALQNAQIPISLINGSIDPVSGSHLVDRYKELGCRLDHLKALDTIGHYPHVEAADAVTTAYLEFLSNNGAS